MQNHSPDRQPTDRLHRRTHRQLLALLLGLMVLVYGPILYCGLYMLILHQWIPALAILLGLAIMTVPPAACLIHTLRTHR